MKVGYFSWLPSLFIGVIIGVFVRSFSSIHLIPELRFDSLASLLISVVLFFGMNILYTKYSNVARTEKDLIINLIRDGLTAAEGLDRDFQGCHREDPLTQDAVTRIQAGLQRFNNAVHSIERALESCGIDKKKAGFESTQREREQYRQTLTDTPFPIRYEMGILREQQGHNKRICDALRDMIFQLNRL